jgi:hypothetical protein
MQMYSYLRFEASIDRTQGRKIYVKGNITSADSKTVYADALGLWVVRYLQLNFRAIIAFGCVFVCLFVCLFVCFCFCFS